MTDFNTDTPAGSKQRSRMRLRPLDLLYRLPPSALVTPSEASAVTQLTESALAVRRSKGQWPPFLKFGRLVRYGLGELLTPPNEGRKR